MKRMFGMMPSSEVEIEKLYRDDLNLKIIIQSGKHGYSIIYADSSAEFKDIDDTAENNFNLALSIVKEKLGELKEETGSKYEICIEK